MPEPLSRLTLPTLVVLRVLYDRRGQLTYGLQIAKATGMKSGALYPILARLERAGWVAGCWEQLDAASAGRPPRHYYQLTGQAVPVAAAALSGAYAALSGPALSGSAPVSS